jgi:hypothetical protein
MSLQSGMMTTTARYGDGEISTARFIFGYYSRFFLGFIFRRSPVIIDQASGNQREEQVK